MTKLAHTLQSPHLVGLAERDLGLSLQNANARVLTVAEAALELCKKSPEYTTGPFIGFHSVLKKDATQPSDRQAFMHKVHILDGRALLLPFPDRTIRRTLIRCVDTERVALTVLDEPARLSVSPAERTLLSAVNAYDDPVIGTHQKGIASEPGHVALTSAVVLGAFRLPGQTSIHGAVHAFEHKDGIQGNILAASAQTGSYLGARLVPREFTYDTWPSAMELVWHPEEGSVATMNEDDAVLRVQAAGFVSLREAGLVSVAVQTLGDMR